MRKPTICLGENKGTDQLVTTKLISAFVFATRIVQFLFYLNPKFQASSSFLCLYSVTVCQSKLGNVSVSLLCRNPSIVSYDIAHIENSDISHVLSLSYIFSKNDS